MMLGAATYGGAYTTGGWIDLIPPDDASIDVWKKALAMAYQGKISGNTTLDPGNVAYALADRYLQDSNVPGDLGPLFGAIASMIAQISNNQTVESILTGVEWAARNIPSNLVNSADVEYSGVFRDWRNAAIAASQQTSIYPLNLGVFGSNSDITKAFEVHTVKTPTAPLNTTVTSTTNMTTRPSANTTVTAPRPVTRAPVPAPAQSGLSIAAIAGLLASFFL